jgi:hypothetical protein
MCRLRNLLYQQVICHSTSGQFLSCIDFLMTLISQNLFLRKVGAYYKWFGNLLYCSTVGNEASGTSNMKFAMNGCLLLAARGGSNDEIREEIGDENIVKLLSTLIDIAFITSDVIINT